MSRPLPAKDAHSDEHAQSDGAQRERQQANHPISSFGWVSAYRLHAPGLTAGGRFLFRVRHAIYLASATTFNERQFQ